jgi:putative endonuclease
LGIYEFTIFRKNSPLTATHIDRGIEGENIAARALKKSRYKIIERNYRTPAGEIDIIARDKQCVVFVEVRTRSSVEFGLPQETVVARKRKRICNAAKWYLQKEHASDIECRFDVVAVIIDEKRKKPQVEIIRNAFRPEKGNH